jgi:hypothetical protein
MGQSCPQGDLERGLHAGKCRRRPRLEGAGDMSGKILVGEFGREFLEAM